MRRIKIAGAARPLHEATLSLVDGAIETLRSGRDDEAVHAARRSCKKIRAALRLLRQCLGTRVYRRENARVRDAAKPLTAVRDAFMLIKTLPTLPDRPDAWQSELTSEYRGQRMALDSGGAQGALEHLQITRAELLGQPLAGSEAASAVAGVVRAYKAGRKAERNARDSDDEALHEWRKQAKYLLNQLELLNTVFHAEYDEVRRRADKLTGVLGDDHDLALLAAKLRSHAKRPLLKDIKKRRRKLQARAFRLGKRLYRRSAKHFESAVIAALELNTPTLERLGSRASAAGRSGGA